MFHITIKTEKDILQLQTLRQPTIVLEAEGYYLRIGDDETWIIIRDIDFKYYLVKRQNYITNTSEYFDGGHSYGWTGN